MPACRAPGGGLAGVLELVLVEGGSVDLEDEPPVGPAEVGFFAGDPDVDLRHGEFGVSEGHDGEGFGVRAAAVELELVVALELVRQRLGSLSRAPLVQM